MSETTEIRASALTMYPDCERRGATNTIPGEIAAAGYVLRELPAGIGMPMGSALHMAASVMLTAKAKTGKLASVSDADDAAIDLLREAVAPGVHMDRETPTINDAEIQIRRMSKAFRDNLAPNIQPIVVEEKLRAKVPWSTEGLVLTGHPDVIAREPGAVDDIKGGKRLSRHAPQIGAYSLLARSEGLEITKGRVSFIQRLPLKKDQPRGQIDDYDIAQCESAAVNVLRHIDRSLSVFRKGDPERHVLPGDPWAFSANPGSKLCSAKFCKAWGTDFCHEHAKEIEDNG